MPRSQRTMPPSRVLASHGSALRFEYSDGQALLVVLVEHWSSASKLDLLRTARYYLDLCRRFPTDEVLPIALVDDGQDS